MGAVLGIVVLDETVVGVALPTIVRDLGLTQVASHWVINAYLLVFTCLAAAAGRLGDIVGLRALFVIGILAGRRLPPLDRAERRRFGRVPAPR